MAESAHCLKPAGFAYLFCVVVRLKTKHLESCGVPADSAA